MDELKAIKYAHRFASTGVEMQVLWDLQAGFEAC